MGNPGPGAWAAVLEFPSGNRDEIYGKDPDTTNNRMELTAVISALEHPDVTDVVSVISDSRYVVDGASSWIHGWKRNGWISSSGQSVRNRDLWERLDHLAARHGRVGFRWVRGHSGNPGNERANSLAEAVANGEPPPCLETEDRWIHLADVINRLSSRVDGLENRIRELEAT